MLKNIFIKFRLPEIKLTHISLALVGLMWVFPFLHYRHENPLTSFDQEWWSAMLGVLALSLLLARDYWPQPEIPRIVQLPVALIAIALVQSALGMVAYFDQALLYVSYLSFAAMLMLLGARLRACLGIEKMATILAFALLAGSELSALIGVLQHYQWHTPLDQVITRKISVGVYGNLAQPNHFANYIALGLISLGLLLQQRKLKTAYVILLALPLLFVMTLSGSRSSWLYLLLMGVMAWWMARREAAMRPLLRYSLLLIVGFGLMHLIVQLPFMSGSTGGTTTVQRLLAESGGDTNGSVRLYLWREAGLIFAQAPWLGVGFGQFAWHHFELLPVLRPNYISDYYNNAHNLILQLAAETGIAGLLALFGSLGIWIYGLHKKYAIFARKTFVPVPNRAKSKQRSQNIESLGAAHWWGYAILGVLAIHSLLEYPLWYVYFVAVASLMLGAFDETFYRPKLHNAGRLVLLMIVLLGLLTLLQLRNSYGHLKDTLTLRSTSSNITEVYPLVREGLIAAQGVSLLSPYAELYLYLDSGVNADQIEQKLAMGSRVMHFVPVAPVVYQQAFLLAQDGQLAQAEQLMELAIWSYPNNGGAHQQLVILAEKDPARFSALLEFAAQKEQEHNLAVHH